MLRFEVSETDRKTLEQSDLHQHGRLVPIQVLMRQLVSFKVHNGQHRCREVERRTYLERPLHSQAVASGLQYL
jgi:hypothetical protein